MKTGEPEKRNETRMPDDDLPLFLPGLELGGADLPGGRTALRRAVEQQLLVLAERGLLKPEHAGLAQLTLELADAIAAGRRAGRASAVAMGARELRETLLALPQEVQASEGALFASLVDELRAFDKR